jgi:hypothetical protein
MRSVRCDVCGTKALMAASKCPKCSHPFAVRDGFGDLLPLAHCPTCDSDYPLSAGACKWCGTPPEKTPIGPYVWKGVGIAAFVSLGIGAFLIRDDSPATRPALLVATADSATATITPDSSGTPPPIPQATPTDHGVVVSEVVSTGVVGTDTTSTIASTDSMTRDSAGAIASDTATLAAGNAPTATDSTSTVVDYAPVPVDSARAREPWLPPPSVIRRAPAPAPSEPSPDPAPRTDPATSSSTTIASSGASGTSSTSTTNGGAAALLPPTETPASADRSTRTRDAEPAPRVPAPPRTEAPPRTVAPPRAATPSSRSSTARSTTARSATSRPAPSRPKAKPPARAVVKATPKPTPPRVATKTSRTTRGKVASSTPRSSTSSGNRAGSAKVAKAPPPRATTSARWVTSIARQWVVVRADANGRGRIIGSVGPDTRVQLGESRNGFRRIKAKGLAGWVHQRAVFGTLRPARRSGRLATQ